MNNPYHKTAEQLDEENFLIAKAQSNSKDFEPLYNQYFERIFRFVYQRVDSKEDASDITAQVFLKALINLKKFEFKAVPFSAWLYRIAVSELSNFYTKSKKDRSVNIDTVQFHEFFEGSNIDLNDERIERITDALMYISEVDLMLIEMRFFENRSFKEIGDIMKITGNNVKVKVYRVIDKLKQKLF